MDLEASLRGTTVYLVDKRIDMLPSLLGTNLCSLRENVERLSFSVIWELTPDARIIDTHFSKSIIKSASSFTYDEAQSRMDDQLSSFLSSLFRRISLPFSWALIKASLSVDLYVWNVELFNPKKNYPSEPIWLNMNILLNLLSVFLI